jgi:hypothetical protein
MLPHDYQHRPEFASVLFHEKWEDDDPLAMAVLASQPADWATEVTTCVA